MAVCALALVAGGARASLVSTPNAFIPDGDLNGVAFTLTVVDGDLTVTNNPSIVDLNLTVDILDGWNGDLFAYLYHEGTVAMILNRVGKTATEPYGYDDSGFASVTFDDQAATDIHLYGTVTNAIPSGSWQPDGRTASPFIVADTSPRNAMLASFNGMDPRGEWVLYVADVSGGDRSRLVSWSLAIEVPEPGTAALLGFAALLWRRRRAALSQA